MSANANATEENLQAGSPSQMINEAYHEVMLSYEKAIKSGIQIQEESMNVWKDLVGKLGSPEEFQGKIESLNSKVLPAARDRMQEVVETIGRASSQTMELCQKSMGLYQSTSIPDAQRRWQDLLDCSLTTARVNVKTALILNTTMVSAWKEMMQRLSPI